MSRDSPEVSPVRVNAGETVADLVRSLAGSAFNAKRLAMAVDIYGAMLADPRCTKIMTLAGAMVPAGMGHVVADFIKHGYVDVLVTTGANLTHDVIEAIGCHHYQGSEDASDKDLHTRNVNRIFDVFMPDEAYESLEDFVQVLEFDKQQPLVDFLDYLGSEIATRFPGTSGGSILRACHEAHVPVYCPAFTDCGLGIQLMLNHRGLQLDMFEDLNRFIGMAWKLESTGVFIVGGGVPKNFTFQALQFSPNSATYAIQVTTDRPEPGGLSGATLSEAISWGKVNENAQFVTVMCDATIVLPIVLACLKTTVPR